jgi:amino acid adenylation domain-containing protein/non-ribosomal peptide synthase protein (TIGR01720 family)
MTVPLQVPGGIDQLSWEVLEPEGPSSSGEADQVDRLFQQDRERPADLGSDPPSRWVLLASSPDRHVLFFSVSSLCADRESLKTIVSEVASCVSQGSIAGLSEAPLQYADFSAWYNQLVLEDDEEATEGRAFWANLDLSALSTLVLPTEIGGASSEPDFASLPLELAAALRAALTQLTGTRGVPRSELFFAAWQVLVWRLTGRSDLIVSRVCSGRSVEDLEGAVGLYARCLPVARRWEATLSFGELLARNAKTMEDAAEWEEYGIWDAAKTAGAATAMPVLFDDGDWGPELSTGGVSWSILRQSVITEPFKWRLSMAGTGDRWSVSLDYDKTRFEAADVQLVGDRLLEVLAQVASDPDIPIGQLEVVSPAEREAVAAFNDTSRGGPVAGTIVDRFEEAARRFAGRTAVVFEEASIAYGELEARSDKLARHLVALGVSTDVRVALLTERSLDMIVGMLGILKAGGAYVPLDPALPRRRLQWMVEDARPAALLTQEDFSPLVEVNGILTLLLDGDWSEGDDGDTLAPVNRSVPQGTAYVIFTSGSTGRPKGVVVEHRQLLNYTTGILEVLASRADWSFATVTTVAADLGNTAIFPALASGGCLHVLSQDRVGDPEAMAEYFARHPIDVLKIVPSHLAALLLTADPARVLPRRTLVLGGEALSWRLAREVRSASQDLAVVNHYGPTETTVGILVNRLERDGLETGKPATVPIGRPLSHCRAYLADSGLRAVAFDVVGEIFLAGDNVTRGYLGLPARTSETFVPDPFSQRPGGRLYRTGDLGRLSPEGQVEFVGRRDHQVKIRGFRIELGEIERNLLEHPAVREAVLLARQDDANEKHLVAYLVARPSPEVQELRAFLRERVPDYMVPAAFVVLGSLPLGANGKVDRQALPAPENAGRSSGAAYVAPRTAAEKVLAEVWKQVLAVDTLGIHDNFFEMGGDSILVIQVVARASRQGVRLSPRQFFEHQTIAELAPHAEHEAASTAEQGTLAGESPLLPIQSWFFEQDFPSAWHWNQAMLLEVGERLDVERLRAALLRVLEHHDALRMSFERTASGWRQVYGASPAAAPLRVVDLSGLAGDERHQRIEAVAGEAQRSFDLSAGPLFSAVYFDLGDHGPPDRLFVAAHHLVMDGVSWRILLEDLSTLCRQLASGESPELPPKTTSLRQWAARLQEHANSGMTEDETAWWRRAPPVAEVPADEPGGDNTLASRDFVSVALDEEETRTLLQVAPAAYRTQVNDILLTALVKTFGRLTGRAALWLELEGHGREDLFDDVDLSRTVGWFTTHYPVFLDVEEAGADLGASLKAVKEQLRRIPARGLGHGLLRYMADDEVAAVLRAQPHPQVGFNYMGQTGSLFPEDSLFSPAAEPYGATMSPDSKRRSLIDVASGVTRDRFRASWRYSRNIHRRETIERLAEGFLGALRALLEHCSSTEAGGVTPSDFSLVSLSQDQLNRLVAKVGSATGKRW